MCYLVILFVEYRKANYDMNLESAPSPITQKPKLKFNRKQNETISSVYNASVMLDVHVGLDFL